MAEMAAILAGMTEQALSVAPEPFTPPPNTILEAPTADAPLGVVAGEVTGAGWGYVWNTRTGERVRVNRWQLLPQNSVLKKRHTDDAYPEFLGRQMFTLTDPGIDRVYG